MILSLERGATSVTFRLKLIKTSTQQGFTGLLFSSTGLIISSIADVESAATAYTQAGGTIETITTLGTFAAPTATKIRFKEVDATNHKGVYEVQIADARMAVANMKQMIISFSGVTDMDEQDLVINFNLPVDARLWKSQVIPTPNATGVPKVDVTHDAGTARNTFTCPGGGTTGAGGIRIPNGGPAVYQGDKLITTGGATAEGSTAIVDTIAFPGGGIQDVSIVGGAWNGPNPANGTTVRVERNNLRPVSVADIWANGTRTLTAPTNLTSDNSVIGRESTLTTLAAAVAALNALELAIKAKTDGLPADTAGVLNAIDDYIDTEVGAIKAKTDLLTFTSGRLQVDALYVNGTRVYGTGVLGDIFRTVL